MVRKTWGLDYFDESSVSSAPRAKAGARARKVLDTLSVPAGYPPDLPARDCNALNAAILPKNTSGNKSGGSSDTADEARSLRDAYSAAWSLAFAPARGLLTGAFACFMTGGSVHMFSVMTALGVSFMQISGLANATALFRGVVERTPALKGKIVPQFLVHFLLCCLGVAGALWQCHRLGFLPTTESDYTALLPTFDVRDLRTVVGGIH